VLPEEVDVVLPDEVVVVEVDVACWADCCRDWAVL
jgi:hypothetical protein